MTPIRVTCVFCCFMADLTTIERQRLSTESVAGGTGLYSRSSLRALPWAFDDLGSTFGDDIYQRMLIDPQVCAVVNTLRAAIIEEGVRLESPLSDSSADGYDLAREIDGFCESVLADLQIPLDDVLWDLLSAIALGSRAAEQVYQDQPATAYALPGTSPISRTQQLLVLSALKPKPRRATAFVVDAYMNVHGLVAQQAGQGYGATLGGLWAVDGSAPNVMPRDRFAILSFRPENGDPRGVSILRPAYTPWWNKQQAIQDFLKYLAQFASPSLYAVASEDATKSGVSVTAADGSITIEPAVTVLLDTLLAFQNGTAAAFPYGTLLQVLESSGEGQPFHNAFTWCDSQITIAVLHQTRATMEAEHGSRADSQTGQDILDTIVRQAKRSVATMLRRDVLTPLISYNYGSEAARTLTPNVSLGSVEQQDFAAFATAIAALAKSGYLDPSQYAGVDEKLGLPPRTEGETASSVPEPVPDDSEESADESV